MYKLRKFVTPILIATPLVWLLIYCSNPLPAIIGKKIWLTTDSTDSIALRDEVRRVIPIGSSITNAKWLLEINGFRCKYRQSSDPTDGYLACDQTQSYLVCAITYRTAVMYLKNVVIRVEASTGSYCL